MSKRMLRKSAVASLLSFGLAASVMAQSCPCTSGTRVLSAALPSLLGGRTVCATVGDERWQEFHSGSTTSGGPLVDYKQGPGNAIDPSESVGSYSIVGADTDRSGARVRYDYGSGGAYEYAVCQTGASNIAFCGVGSGRNITGATLLPGQVSCGGARGGAATAPKAGR